MKNIKLGLTALALSTLLTACPDTGKEKPGADITNHDLSGTVQEVTLKEIKEDGAIVGHKPVAHAWSQGEQPVNLLFSSDGTVENANIVAIGRINEAGTLSATLPKNVDPAYTKIRPNDVTEPAIMQTLDDVPLNCTGELNVSDETARMYAAQFAYGDQNNPLWTDKQPSLMQMLNLGGHIENYVYATVPVSIKGTKTCSGTVSTETEQKKVETVQEMNISFAKGWNYITCDTSINSRGSSNGTQETLDLNLKHSCTSATPSQKWYVEAVATELSLPDATFPSLR